MIPQIVTAIVAGILSHQTKPIIDNLDTSSQTVRNLANYSIGFIAIGIVFECALYLFRFDKDQIVKASAAFWLSGVFTGIGVFLGYVLDSVRGK